MNIFDTNVLNASLATHVPSSVNYGTTFYTSTSVLSSYNFTKNTSLSTTPYATAGIPANTNITAGAFTTICVAMPTTSGFTAAGVHTITYPTQQFFLSATGGVTHVNFVSAGTINGQNVYGIAFNKLADSIDALNYNTTSLSAYSGVKFTVNNAYDGDEMAFILQNRTTVPFTATVSKAQTASQGLSSATQDSVPEVRRLVQLGFL